MGSFLATVIYLFYYWVFYKKIFAVGIASVFFVLSVLHESLEGEVVLWFICCLFSRWLPHCATDSLLAVFNYCLSII